MKRRICATAAALAAAVALYILPVCAAPQLSAQCAVLMDADTGSVLFEQNADERALIASTTKIMTALTVLRLCDPDETVTIPPEATGIEGTSIYLTAGEKLTVRDLLYGLLLSSGNDAAVALAIHAGGSVSAFVAEMNAEAEALRLEHTHFENPSGLDGERHFSTARDMAALTAKALKNPIFSEIVATKTYTVGERRFQNHNRLLWTLDGALGVKTGYTLAAGRTLVSAAQRNGRTLIAVTLRDRDDWNDHTALYEYGFGLYGLQPVYEKNEEVTRLPLANGQTATLLAGETVLLSLRDGERPDFEVRWPQLAMQAGAPGTHAGYAELRLGERVVATLPLLWGESGIAYDGTSSKNTGCTGRGVP